MTPNPRHDIVRLPDSLPLTQIPPPEPYAQYTSFADIDRRPSLFLADLVTASAGYYHEDCGSFYTFGWCSEREMAFVCLLTAHGYEAKVVQEGIHVWSEVWLPGDTVAHPDAALVVRIDNTFDSFSVREAMSGEKEWWLHDYGEGASVGWYNRVARSPEEVSYIGDLRVSTSVRKRIEALTDAYIEGYSDDLRR